MKNSIRAVNFLALATVMFGLVGCGLMKKEPAVEINHKIVGKWSGKTFDGAHSVVWDFAKSGEVKMSQDGKEITNQKYRLIDDKTLELETKSQFKSEAKMEFSNNDNTMIMTDFVGFKATFKRE
jgi:hypothetical protein